MTTERLVAVTDNISTDSALTELFNVTRPTMNSTLAPSPQYYDPLYKIIGFLFVSVIFFVGLVGNLMVILVVWRTRSMRTPTNCYLVSLAAADILLLVTAPLPTLIEFFLIKDQFIFGAVGCVAVVSQICYYYYLLCATSEGSGHNETMGGVCLSVACLDLTRERKGLGSPKLAGLKHITWVT